MKMTKAKEREVKSQLVLRGREFQDIAKKLGIRRSQVCDVFKGRRKTRYIQVAIAKAAGLPVSYLFGE